MIVVLKSCATRLTRIRKMSPWTWKHFMPSWKSGLKTVRENGNNFLSIYLIKALVKTGVQRALLWLVPFPFWNKGMVLGHWPQSGFWLKALKCYKVSKQSGLIWVLWLSMLPCFREDGASEEPTASMEDLEFKVHKNTSEGAEHFIQFLFRKTPLSYSNQIPHPFQQKRCVSRWMLHQEAWRPLGAMCLKEMCKSI